MAYDVASVAFLASLGCAVGVGGDTGWIVLAFVYGMRVCFPYPYVGYAHNAQLYVWAMLVEAFPLTGARRVAVVVRSYWPLLLCVLFLGIIRDTGRCDLFPAASLVSRLRFYGVGAALAVAFVVGGVHVSDPYGEMAWLNLWALYAYLFHVFWARVLPLPYGAIVTCSSAIIFKAAHVYRRRLRLARFQR
mmetsp:Transcript_66110/g.182565  ORF Transcript_66110/g.182565 Transcript_66110/m.182565 type:complete len:190 (-) Transcript_66110:46-615(-)